MVSDTLNFSSYSKNRTAAAHIAPPLDLLPNFRFVWWCNRKAVHSLRDTARTNSRANSRIHLRKNNGIDPVDHAVAGDHVGLNDLGVVDRDVAAFNLYVEIFAVEG